jgi:uncharacterized protein YdaU (DUF1376 family)
MTDLPWFKFYHQDWLAGTTGLSMAERGCYITLLALMYDAGGSILRDDGRLARRCGCPTPNFKSALQALIDDGKIIQDGDQLTNERVKKEVMARENIGAMAREKAASRWNKSKEKQQSENAAAMPQQCKSEVRSQNISSNEDITREATPLAILSECLSEQSSRDLIEHRKKLRKPLTARAAKLLVKDFIAYGNPEEAVEMMIKNGWQGFHPTWITNQAARAGPQKSQKGWGSLYAELNGYGDGIGQKRIDEAVSLLPRSAVDGAGDRDGDAGGLPGDVVELFASGRG